MRGGEVEPIPGLPPIPDPATRPTLRVALQLYRERISILKKGYPQEKYRIEQFLRHPLADKVLSEITSVDVAYYRDQRLTAVNPRTGKPVASSTVRLDLALLSDLFRIAIIEWGYANENPVLKVRKPKLPPGRDRLLTAREEKRIRQHCQRWGMLEMDIILTLALETGARQGEILGITWEQVQLKDGVIHLPKTKNGRPRSIPLSLKAREALVKLGPKGQGRLFSYSSAGFKSSWRGMLKALNIEGLHFHDCRHTALTRLHQLGTLTVMEIATISGHQTLSMLQRYTHLSTKKLTHKLEGGKNRHKAALLSVCVPYPAILRQQETGYQVVFPDFEGASLWAQDRTGALDLAQMWLLRELMRSFRKGIKPPESDHYLGYVDENQVIWVDPLSEEPDYEISREVEEEVIA